MLETLRFVARLKGVDATAGAPLLEQVGIVKETVLPQARLLPSNTRYAWQALVERSAIAHLTIRPADVDAPDTARLISISTTAT